MSKVRVELNRSGVRELLRSEEMRAVVKERADEVVQRCGEGYEADSYVGRNRVNATISTTTYRAYYSNLKNNTVLKALK